MIYTVGFYVLLGVRVFQKYKSMFFVSSCNLLIPKMPICRPKFPKKMKDKRQVLTVNNLPQNLIFFPESELLQKLERSLDLDVNSPAISPQSCIISPWPRIFSPPCFTALLCGNPWLDLGDWWCLGH